jgi:integrase
MEIVEQSNKEDAAKSKRRASTAGQIIPRGEDTWLVRIFMGRDGKGKRHYLNKTIRGKKKDAQDYLSKTLTAISTGTFVEPSPLTVGEYLDKWLDSVARIRVRPRTFASYNKVLERYARPKLKDRKLSSLQPLEVQALYTEMQRHGLSAKTIRYVHTILHSAFKQAVTWGVIARNPAEAVELPRRNRKEMQAFSPEDAMLFLQATIGNRLHALFVVALFTGMRPSEYLGLKWSDVDLEKGTVTVQRSLVESGKGCQMRIDETKTAHSRRSIPLPPSVIRVLIEQRRKQAEERLAAGANYRNQDFVFAKRLGEPFQNFNMIRRYFKRTLKRAGLPETIRLYDLRHSCATLMLAQGEHPKVVSEWLGHASTTLTLDVYSHVLPSMRRDASDRLEQTIWGKGQEKPVRKERR